MDSTTQTVQPISRLLDGWNSYQASLIRALEPLASEHLAWRPARHLRSVGELARHISLGRVAWFHRMGAPGSEAVVARIEAWEEDDDGNLEIVEDQIPITENTAQLIRWLEISWRMVETTLTTWTVDDLAVTYPHTWQGTNYAVSRQWTIWRIMSHDIHHGGELSLMLGMQGIEAFELGALGGHTILPMTMEEIA